MDVVNLEQLSMLGKAIMSAAVEAEMLGLYTVRPYLDRAFDEVVVEARGVRVKEVETEAERLLRESGEVVGES